MPRKKRGIEEDLRIFWGNVDKSKGPERCWLWTGEKYPTGYGYTQYDGKRWKTSRLAFTLQRRPIPDGKYVLHTCDTPACVQKLHLFLGTQADNVRDMDLKGRRGTIKGQFAGEKHALAKLTNAQVDEIRQAHQAGGILQKQLAEEYGVVPSTISHIIRGARFGGPNIRRTAKENSAAIRGENHHESKLTTPDVQSIRLQHAEGVKMRDLSNEYSVTTQMIWRIVHRKAWAHVE